MAADQQGLRQACFCGLPPHVGSSRSAKNPGRIYANCSRFPSIGHCRYFTWLDGCCGVPAQVSPPRVNSAPKTPEREEPPARCTAQLHPVHLEPHKNTQTASSCLDTTAAQGIHRSERLAVYLVVSSELPALLLPEGLQQPVERVCLVLLPASADPAEHCTRTARRSGEGQLPQARPSLLSMQPPYIQLRHCAAARGLAGAMGRTSCHGGLYVLDCETTGLSGRDYVHQLAVLNVASCQLLTAVLRTCPRTIGREAAEVCGVRNPQLHDPNRPTFGQLQPLLEAFMAAGSCRCGACSGSTTPPLVVAHNGSFDARMLIGEWSRRGMPVPREWRLLDTLPLARACLTGCANYKQGTLRQHFGISLPAGEADHDAGTDVTVLAQLLPLLLRAAKITRFQDILGGLKVMQSGLQLCRTFGDVQDRMRGAVGAEAAASSIMTCPYCYAPVVQ